METIELDSKKVAWLLAIPISEAERSFAINNGSNKLEDLFEKHQIDIYDLDRSSIV